MTSSSSPYDPNAATLIVHSNTTVVTPGRPTIDLAAADDTGSSDIDNVTQNTTLHFIVTGDPGTSVIIKEGSIQIDGPFTMPANGVIAPTITWPVAGITANGPHPLTAISTNSTGGSNQSEQLLVTIDTVAPSAPSVPELLLDSDSNIIGDGITNVNPPRFQDAEANSTVSLINIFGEVIGVGTTGSDDSDGVTGNGLGTWQITVSPLSEGINLISADAEDLAGNIGPETSQSSIVIDTVIPQRPTITLIARMIREFPTPTTSRSSTRCILL